MEIALKSNPVNLTGRKRADALKLMRRRQAEFLQRLERRLNFVSLVPLGLWGENKIMDPTVEPREDADEEAEGADESDD